MIIGVLNLDIHIPTSASLKEKRMVMNSIKDRLRKKYNVSVAEIGFHDKWQRAELAIVSVSGDKSFVDEALNKIFQFLDTQLEFEIIKYDFDYR